MSFHPIAQLKNQSHSKELSKVRETERRKKMVLSQRLMAVSDLVSAGNRLADIGTDHAFVPIYLVEHGQIPSAIAMDVNPGPLARADDHIRMHGLADRIITRLSDGLDQLAPGEADTVLVAGMGGALTVRILEQREGLTGDVKELVLQPQSEIASVRRFLERSGWRIVSERMVFEEGKYYQMMRCVPGKMRLSAAEAEYGPCLMQERSTVWSGYLLWRKEILDRNLLRLQNAEGERGEKRRREILEQRRMIDACR